MAIFVNPWVESLEAYVPGEQPRDPKIIKLNTNECPYANPAIAEAMRVCAADDRFQKYPDPDSVALREAVASRLDVDLDQVMAGNGSDEVLRLICQAFIRPGSEDAIGVLEPTYSLYETLGAMHGAETRSFAIHAPDYAIPSDAFDASVKIFFLPNPNPPIGTLYPLDDLRRLATSNADRLVVIDEAYVDFGPRSAVALIREFENVLVTRTFSKSYAMAGMRVGFVIGPKSLISVLEKIKDSYNLNRASQAAALAAWNDTVWHKTTTDQICKDREFLTEELRKRGFEVTPSKGNFVFARRPDAVKLYQDLKEKGILVRYFNRRSLADGVRITIGTPEEIAVLLKVL